jgi:CRISPR-associated protein Cas6
MIWLDEEQETTASAADVCDLTFRLTARILPLDHAWELSRALLCHLPWLEDEPRACIHLVNYPGNAIIDGAAVDSAQKTFYVSKRARLSIRLPVHRVDHAVNLSGCSLDIDGHKILIGPSRVRQLVPSDTLLARHVIHDESVSEEKFVDELVNRIRDEGINIRKVVCGQTSHFRLPTQSLSVRSVLVADLKLDDSITLQSSNLGDGRLMGCGIFIPHKGLGQVKRQP